MTLIIVAVVTSTIGLLGNVVKSIFDRGKSPQDRLLLEVRILNGLPEGGKAYNLQLGLIERQLTGLALGLDEGKTRDTAGLGLSIFLLGGAAFASFALLQNDFGLAVDIVGWVIVGLIALFGVVGLGSSVSKRHRDERGNEISADFEASSETINPADAAKLSQPKSQ